MGTKDIRRRVHCCACRGKIDRVNLVDIDRLASWKYPTGANLLTGESGKAIAICCDPCIEGKQPILEAVEFTDNGGVLYHPLEELPKYQQGETHGVQNP
jgi:hypothetical protein